jgi:hypothetical protein
MNMTQPIFFGQQCLKGTARKITAPRTDTAGNVIGNMHGHIHTITLPGSRRESQGTGESTASGINAQLGPKQDLWFAFGPANGCDKKLSEEIDCILRLICMGEIAARQVGPPRV